MSKEQKPIIGGIFGTHTEWDAEGNVTVKDDFHLRIYWDLFHTGAIAKLKGNMLHVYLTIAMHLDNRGKGWPTQDRIAKLCGINRETVVNAIKKLVKAGFVEAIKIRTKGKFDNTVYKIKFAPQTNENNHDGKTDTVESEENKGFDHVGKTNTEKPTRKNQHGKSDTKKDFDFKKDPSFKKDIDDDALRIPNIWDEDSQYKAFRGMFLNAGASDIIKHEEHYEKFKAAISAIGFVKLLETAEKYITAEGKQSQIVYFLSGHYNQYIQDKTEKKKARVSKMPISFQKQKAHDEIKQAALEAGATITEEELQGTYDDIYMSLEALRNPLLRGEG